ncbi:MAG: ABC transporter substrate-binding protein [Chloroflexi bacterium]|nr:ABC transporter substrate-binding protein [Chloroflexota bacterium]
MTTLKRKGMWALVSMATLALLIASCGGDDDTPTPRPTATTTVAQPTTTAPTATVPPAPQRGGILNLRSTADPRNLDPLQSLSSSDVPFMVPVFDTFIRSTPDFGVTAGLAESWDVRDGTNIVFVLREGVKFHDGTPLNAEAVKAHFDRAVDEQLASIQGQFLTSVENIEVLSGSHLSVSTFAPNALLVSFMADRLGFINSPTAVNSATLDQYTRNPVGTGPFALDEWVSDSHITYSAFDDYWQGGLPLLDGIKRFVIEDPAVALAAFRSGELDVYKPEPAQVGLIENDPDLTIVSWSSPGYNYFQLNRTMEPFGDIRVRRALSMAVDRAALIQLEYDGRATILYGPIPPIFAWAYDPDFKAYEYNPDEARRLLAEAGFPNGFTIDPVVWFGGTARRPRLEALQQMYGDIGVKLELLQIASGDASRGFQREWIYPAYSSALDPRTELQLLMSEHFKSTNAKNVGKTEIPGYDALLVQAEGTFDLVERGRLYRQMQKMVVEDMAMYVFLHIPFVYEAVRDYVIDYVSHPTEQVELSKVRIER